MTVSFLMLCFIISTPTTMISATREVGAFFSTAPSIYKHNSNVPRKIIWYPPHNTRQRRRTSIQLDMALTDEFIQMNNDKEITSADTNTQQSTTTATNKKRIESTILSSVESLARGVGSAGNNLVTDPMTSSSAFGIFSGRATSRRTQLIKWQRENLRNVRKEINFWYKYGKEDSNAIRNTNSNMNGNGEGDRMTPLIAALPSNQKTIANQNEKVSKGDENEKKNGNNTNNNNEMNSSKQNDSTLITTALETLERDMALLDNVASSQSQLSGTEVSLLIGAVIASGIGPIFFPGTSVTELLAPAAAAFTASITIGSEYVGRVAVADGKEIAANTIQCAAEAEAFLANAERVKAISPLCVGIGATCAAFSLLAPAIIEAMNLGSSVTLITEIYLFCPLVSVLAAAVCNLALEETKGFASRATNVGVRRFSKRSMIGQTWLSSSEQVQRNSKSKTDRWKSFIGSVLPAPIVGSILGGPSLSAKCIVITALAAVQSAYFLAQAESVLARATDAVALKARSAAVCDTYANQGARNSAILPFTSALSAFCAAATAATVELPFLDVVSTSYGTLGEVALVSSFPILSSTFAAAAAVSKARCEVDAEAAAQAASTLALEYDTINGNSSGDPVLSPFKAVAELVRLALSSGLRGIRKGVINPFQNTVKIFRQTILGLRWRIRMPKGRRKLRFDRVKKWRYHEVK